MPRELGVLLLLLVAFLALAVTLDLLLVLNHIH